MFNGYLVFPNPATDEDVLKTDGVVIVADHPNDLIPIGLIGLFV